MADSLLDRTTRHQVWLQRLASFEANTFDPAIKEADKVIRDVLSGRELVTVKDLNAAISAIRERVTPIYGNWTDSLLGDLEDIAESESEFNENLFSETTLATFAALSAGAAWRYTRSQPVNTSDNQALPMDTILKGFTDNEVRRINSVIRRGFSDGWSMSDIIREIRGRRENKFRDGILATTTRNAKTIARTLTNKTASDTRMAVLRKNKDILKGWEFLATLDSRTSNICRFNDGQQFDIGSGPVPPLHFACRSAVVPVVKEQFKIFDDSTRASKGADGGKQTTEPNYYQWLKTQPKYFQQDVLGKTKTELFRNGGLTADEFRKLTSDNFGQPLDLDQIKRRDQNAWERAGID